MKPRERVAQLVKMWPKVYPGAHCELDFRNPLQLLVATILSAQCTDKRVNMVTPALFKKYRTANDYANAPQAEFENAIKSTGFYRNKTKSIRAAMRAISEKHDGKVPETMEKLRALPGVTGSSGMVAGVVLRESQTAVSAKFSGYAPAAKFFCERGKRRGQMRTPIEALASLVWRRRNRASRVEDKPPVK